VNQPDAHQYLEASNSAAGYFQSFRKGPTLPIDYSVRFFRRIQGGVDSAHPLGETFLARPCIFRTAFWFAVQKFQRKLSSFLGISMRNQITFAKDYLSKVKSTGFLNPS
jgi:hypothetical protein